MGTFRAMDEKWRFKAHDLIKRHTDGIALAMDAEIDLHIDIGYPSVYNDASVNDKVISITRSFFGNENVEETELRMGAEDFGYYTREIPGCFFRLGTGNIEKGITSGVHTPTFDIDERAIEIGMASMAVIGAKLRYLD